MANLYGVTKTDPVNAPVGVVGTPGVAVSLPQGFTVPSLKNGSIGGNLSVGGTLTVSGIISLSNTLNNTSNITNLSTLNVAGAATFSNTIAISGKVNSTVLPETTTTYNLGSTSFRWANGYFSTLDVNTINSTTTNVSGTLTVSTGLNVNGITELTGNLTSTASLIPKELKFNNTTYVHNSQNTVLDFFTQATFSGTITGCLTSPSATITYSRIGNLVILSSSQTLEATSNATTMTITGLPAWLTPSTVKTMTHIVKDNGTLTQGRISVGTDGVLTFYKDAAGAAFTSSGTKGIIGLSCCYIIT